MGYHCFLSVFAFAIFQGKNNRFKKVLEFEKFQSPENSQFSLVLETKSLQIPRRILFFVEFHPYLNFNVNIVITNIKDTALAAINGYEVIKIPYISHRRTPINTREIQPNEISLVRFVFHDFTTCGINATVVNIPAVKPTTSIDTIFP